MEVIVRAKNALMTTVSCFAASRNGNTSHSFRRAQFDNHRCGILISLSIGILKYIEVIGLCHVVRITRYDPVLCLLAV